MKRLFISILFIAVNALAAFAETDVRVQVPDVVAADEQFTVTFIIEGSEKPKDFTWDQGSDFQLVWGPQQSSSTSMQIINGKTTKSSQVTYSYVLLPKAKGTFILPAATAKLKGGKEISSKTVTVEVVGGGSSSSSSSSSRSQARPARPSSPGGIADDDLFLNLSFSRTRAVVGEPIEATLKLYQRVNIAGFEDARFPSFEGFWSQETEAPTNIEFRRENYNDQIYNTAVLRKYILIPQQTGVITIDPAELVCLVQVRVASSGGVSIFDGFFDDYRTIRKRVSSSSYKINVSPLPAGAPASFGGGVGKFSISAKLNKDSLMTHEAASLLVTVSGRGNVSLLETPKVNFPPDMEVYDTKVIDRTDKSSGGMTGSKTYEFPFIPRSHGDFEMAPIAYSYYDVNAGKYVTLTTPAIRFHVEKGRETTASAGSGGMIQTVSRSGVKSLNEDIRFISTKIPVFSAKGDFFIFSLGWWLTLLLSAVLAAALWLGLRKLAARRRDVAGSRKRKANKMAVKRLKSAGEYLKQNLYTAFYAELHKALLGYISDKLNIPMSELSKERIAELMESRNVDSALAEEFVTLLDACEFARYSPDTSHEAMENHYNAAVAVISAIDSSLGRSRHPEPKSHPELGSGSKATLLALFLLLIPAMNAAAEDAYIDSLWNQATVAYSEGHWEVAAAGYEMISNAGLESAALYNNIGNAYFKQSDLPHAILYYERALKLDPAYSDARYNLGIANNLIQDRIDPVPEFILKSWARECCYLLNGNIWAVLTLVLFILVLAMLLLFLLAARPAGKRTGFFCAIVFLLFALTTFSFSLWQKADYQRADGAIVMRPVSAVKSSPSSESSTDLFILHEGTKVTILDEVGEWRNILLADGRQGWIRSSDTELI